MRFSKKLSGKRKNRCYCHSHLWKKKKEESNNIHVLETVTLVHQRPRQESIDIDFEFSDDEEGSHELAHLEAIRRQKNIFHMQLRARQELLMLARTVGSRVMQLAVCQQDPQFNYDSRGLPISLRDPFSKRNFESLDPPVDLEDGLENDPRVTVPVKTKILRCRNPIRMSLKKGKMKKKMSQIDHPFPDPEWLDVLTGVYVPLRNVYQGFPVWIRDKKRSAFLA